MSFQTSPSAIGSSETRTGFEVTSSHTARSTSSKLAAHTSHCVCVTMTVGARRLSRSGSTRYTESPSPTSDRTWSSISRLLASTFTFDEQQAGRRSIPGG